MKKTRSFLGTLSAVAWSFFGLRRKKDFDNDVEGSLNPLHLFVAILIGLALFIGLLVFLVRMATAG
jgi:hypothetical protein